MEAEALNWIAVITGTIAAFLLGWAVYSPMLFGKGWAEGSGVELGSAQSMPVGAMVAQLVALFLLALVIGRTAMTGDLWTAIIAILAAAAFVMSGGKFFRQKHLCTDGRRRLHRCRRRHHDYRTRYFLDDGLALTGIVGADALALAGNHQITRAAGQLAALPASPAPIPPNASNRARDTGSAAAFHSGCHCTPMANPGASRT